DRPERGRGWGGRAREGPRGEGRVRLQRCHRDLRGSHEGRHHRPHQGRAHGAAERFLGGRTDAHHRGDGGGEAEGGEGGWRALHAARRRLLRRERSRTPRPRGVRVAASEGTLPPEPFTYDVWNTLLRDIVTPEGRVDYPRLAERRD